MNIQFLKKKYLFRIVAKKKPSNKTKLFRLDEYRKYLTIMVCTY